MSDVFTDYSFVTLAINLCSNAIYDRYYHSFIHSFIHVVIYSFNYLFNRWLICATWAHFILPNIRDWYDRALLIRKFKKGAGFPEFSKPPATNGQLVWYGPWLDSMKCVSIDRFLFSSFHFISFLSISILSYDLHLLQ